MGAGVERTTTALPCGAPGDGVTGRRGRRGHLFGFAFGVVVGPDAGGEVVGVEFFGFEPEGEFGFGGVGGVGAVDEVEGGGDAEVAADGAGFGLEAEGGAHHFAAD